MWWGGVGNNDSYNVLSSCGAKAGLERDDFVEDSILNGANICLESYLRVK